MRTNPFDVGVADIGVPGQRAAFDAMRGAARRLAVLLRLWRQRRRDRRELTRLDDRMLKDIGVTRADAEFLINKPFWRE